MTHGWPTHLVSAFGTESAARSAASWRERTHARTWRRACRRAALASRSCDSSAADLPPLVRPEPPRGSGSYMVTSSDDRASAGGAIRMRATRLLPVEDAMLECQAKCVEKYQHQKL